MLDIDYTYWFIYIRPEYVDKIPMFITTSDETNLPLFAYTDKRSILKNFLKIHNKDALIIKKKHLSRQEVNDLARHYQNDIIRKYTLQTKTKSYEVLSLDLYMSEKEYIVAENLCYTEIESIFRYVWDPTDKFKDKVMDALSILGYHELNYMLEVGECQVVNNMNPDIFSAFESIFWPILKE